MRGGYTMTAIDFITSVYADAAYREKPEPITAEDAAYTMNAWKEEGTEYPEWLAPDAFAALWNYLCKH